MEELADRRLVVDAMNVIGSRPTGWWRDRDGAVRDLVARLRLLADVAQHVVVVVDGRPVADLPESDPGGVAVHYARRPGPDAADDRIVELVDSDPDPADLLVVTSDRDLRERVAAHGAQVLGSGTFLRRLDRLEGGS